MSRDDWPGLALAFTAAALIWLGIIAAKLAGLPIFAGA